MRPSLIDNLDVRLAAWHQQLSTHAKRHQSAYTFGAIGVLGLGIGLSLASSDIHIGQLEILWLLVNLLIGAPIAIALTATGLRLSARMAQVELSVLTAFKTCCIATASNVLPVPAGSLVHASALVARGGSVAQSSAIIVVSNLISLGWVVSLAGVALSIDWPFVAACSSGFGILILVSGIFILRRHAPIKLVSAFLILSILRSVVLVGRVLISFFALGIGLGITDAVVFSAAAAAGSLVVVAPSGMGISESLAAFLSLALDVEPAQAFVAIAINSLTALLFAATSALAFATSSSLRRKKSAF